ncbi:MAG TPA: IS21 family transposase, partial [Methylomirabilota bacterium]|nr:IS21 family transposase [Methylomirabilota bacterium]
HMAHGGHLVAEHDELAGKYQLRILPEHGPGAIARTARRVRSSLGRDRAECGGLPEVERRDLAIYEALATAEGAV